MADPAADSGGDTPVPSGTRRQFSLSKLLWLTLLVGLGLGYFVLSRRLVEQQRELVRLREEVGYFAVEDPGKIHVLSVPLHDAGDWKWKLYLPPGSKWNVRCSSNQISPAGYQTADGPGVQMTCPTGQFTLQAFLSRDIDGARHFSLRIDGVTSSFTLSDVQAKERFDPPTSEYNLAGSPAMEQLEPAERVQLLRLRVNEAAAGPSVTGVTAKPTAGLLIYLERQP